MLKLDEFSDLPENYSREISWSAGLPHAVDLLGKTRNLADSLSNHYDLFQ